MSINNSPQQELMKYVNWETFESIDVTNMTITKEENKSILTINKSIKKFICEAPIGSGKSTAIRKWMLNTIPGNKFILIVPTVNIAIEFYAKLCVNILNQADDLIENKIKVCVRDKAFTEFREAINKFIPIVITTYSTASKCLGGIIESFYHKEFRSITGGISDTNAKQELIQGMEMKVTDQYTLVVDEAHLLLENISLIEMCREFNNVALVSATISDISCLSVFKDFIRINPIAAIKYDRKIYVHKLKDSMDEQREIIAKQVVNESKRYDKILIKVEDKNECENLKKAINDEFKKALYYSDKKEVEISDEGKFINPEDVDIIIATSCIQAGQSLKENLLQIFIQTPLDTVSSVHQFIGRNRNKESETHLYLRCIKVPEEKFSFKIANNRYKSRLNQLRANAWLSMNAESWKKSLSTMGEVVIDESLLQELQRHKEENSVKPEELFKGKDLQKEFKGKKKLYDYYSMKLKDLPRGYSIKSRFINEKGVRTRVYRLVKEE